MKVEDCSLQDEATAKVLQCLEDDRAISPHESIFKMKNAWTAPLWSEIDDFLSRRSAGESSSSHPLIPFNFVLTPFPVGTTEIEMNQVDPSTEVINAEENSVMFLLILLLSVDFDLYIFLYIAFGHLCNCT